MNIYYIYSCKYAYIYNMCKTTIKKRIYGLERVTWNGSEKVKEGENSMIIFSS